MTHHADFPEPPLPSLSQLLKRVVQLIEEEQQLQERLLAMPAQIDDMVARIDVWHADLTEARELLLKMKPDRPIALTRLREIVRRVNNRPSACERPADAAEVAA